MIRVLKSIFILLILITLTSFSIKGTEVYICKGPSSKVYHKSNRCKGLSNCSTEIYKVTIEDAKNLGRRSCKIEFK